MNVDLERIKHVTPFALPLLIAVMGLMFLVRPMVSENAREGRDLAVLQQRLAQVRASVAQPPPPPITDDPRAVFQRQVADRDVSSQVILQLSRLAPSTSVANLSIETGARVVVTASSGPQVSGTGAPPDPRFALFETPLTYSPISMSFDADFGRVGRFLWDLRDLPTTIEIRSVDIKPIPGTVGRVRIALELFAYAKQSAPVATTGGVR